VLYRFHREQRDRLVPVFTEGQFSLQDHDMRARAVASDFDLFPCMTRVEGTTQCSLNFLRKHSVA
jgi:hypothetical protein